MLLLLLGPSIVNCYSHEMTRVSHHPAIMLSSFGFEKNGFYNISIHSQNLSKIRLMMTEYSKRIELATYSKYCDTYQISNDSETITFIGNVKDKGVYTPIIIDCDRKVSLSDDKIYNIISLYSNPKYLIDYRSTLFLPMYSVLSKVYLGIFLVWVINGYLYSNFRVKLHTIFSLQPITKSISLCINYIIWESLMTKDDTDIKLKILLLFVDTIFYSLYLVSLAFVGSGWCIFRSKMNLTQFLKIIISSVFVALTILLSPYVSNLTQGFLMFICVVLSFVYYMKMNLINVIIVVRLLDQMIKQPIVASKIKLAKEFVVSSFSLLCLALFINLIILMLGVAEVYATGFFECCFLLENVFIMRSFLFRSEYSGEPQSNLNEGKKPIAAKPCFFIGPKKNEIVLLQSDL
ncbi:hypothetical protein TRFO_12017 [Tritrichomonas foetus]|uniref:Intimal thickness related receptor IRP domain-containing protein n=1 Tax=Tritrichomonas foetus TaxID=1144522 RepID=A0A1J4J371_9EUKA|nr:hypothetical protein TRFO_12017 [Tritrichomonas foetus]|eukprot:OHS93193.1 hypothetical protein TRFO_12017 [Tritrichomonas foetus]